MAEGNGSCLLSHSLRELPSFWMLTWLPSSCLLWRTQVSSLEQLNPGLGSQNRILEPWLLRLLIEQAYLPFLGTNKHIYLFWVPGSLLGCRWMLESSQEHYEIQYSIPIYWQETKGQNWPALCPSSQHSWELYLISRSLSYSRTP